MLHRKLLWQKTELGEIFSLTMFPCPPEGIDSKLNTKSSYICADRLLLVIVCLKMSGMNRCLCDCDCALLYKGHALVFGRLVENNKITVSRFKRPQVECSCVLLLCDCRIFGHL